MPAKAFPVDDTRTPFEAMHGTAYPFRLIEGVLPAGDIPRLHGVIAGGTRRAAKARKLDVDFPVGVGRVIAPGEQTQHDSRVQVIHIAVQIEAIRAIPERPCVDDFGAVPLVVALDNFHDQSPLGIDRDITLAIREVVRSGTPLGSDVAFHAPCITRKFDGARKLRHRAHGDAQRNHQ